MFDWAGMTRPNYPELWQCIAMIVGVYGVGFLGKLFGPIGFVQSALEGRFTWWFGVNNITNDLIWLAPFFLILKGAWTDAGPVGDLGSFLRGRNALVIFLRHAGCTFCRETLADLSQQRKQIEADGTKIVLVHMGGTEEFFAAYGMADVERALWQLLGPGVWARGLASFRKHGVGLLEGDGFQMPGAFRVKEYRHASAGDRPDYCHLS